MNKMQQLRQAASANVNTLNSAQHSGKGGAGGPKVGAGEFEVLLTKAEFAEGQNGGQRGLLAVKVIGGTPAEGVTIASQIGGSFNIYYQTSNAEYLAEQNQDLAKILLQCGVSADKVFDDELETDVEILSHFISLFNRLLAKKQEVKLVVRRKPQKATAANGTPYFFNDILSVIGSTVTAESVPAPEAPAAEAPASAEAPKKAEGKPRGK